MSRHEHHPVGPFEPGQDNHLGRGEFVALIIMVLSVSFSLEMLWLTR